MIKADIPNDEYFRLQDLDSYEILDSEPDPDFDELVELAGQLCNCPVSLISLLDKNRQWFKASKGISESETPRDISFCSHAILQDDVMVVEDAKNDFRFFDNPLVIGDTNFRFYASAPILSLTGHKLGAICVYDNNPRIFSAAEKNSLKILSNQVSKLLELRKKNILIRKRAEEIIVMKNKAITKAMNEHEEINKIISINLHENLAQSIAACILNLKIAKDDRKTRSKQIVAVEKQLAVILNNMRELSYSITPNILVGIPLEDLIQEYIEKIKDTFPFKILFNVIGKKGKIKTEETLSIIRIIEHWLKSLAGKKGISVVQLTINMNKPFQLLMEDNGPELSYAELEEEVFESLVFEFVRTQKGVVDLCYQSGWNVLQVVFP